MATPSRTIFPASLVTDMVNKVKGFSSIATMARQMPIAFTGTEYFVFSMDKDIDLVAEGGAKSAGGITVTPKTIIPLKFEYGARVTDEFMIASDERKLQILTDFQDGFARKLAEGLDMAAMHGINPRTKLKSTIITDSIDGSVTQGTNYTGSDADIETAIQAVEGSGFSCNGVIMSPTFRSALAAKRTTAGERLFPDFAFGAYPATLGAQKLSVNRTVETAYKLTGSGTANASDHAIVGDFDMFRWGYGKEVQMRIIEAGDPDNTGRDLAGHNEVYIRAEAYIGWAILDPNAFARVKTTTQPT